MTTALHVASIAAGVLGGGLGGYHGPRLAHKAKIKGHKVNATDAQMEARMRIHGIKHPIDTLEVAKEVELELRYACAMLMMETSGGEDVFGNDGGNAVQGGTVTKERYEELRRSIADGHPSNGVGPCQLTSVGLLDLADKLGGAWKIKPNMKVGFRYLHELIQEHGELGGFTAYNGSGPAAEAYGERAVALANEFEQIIGRHRG